MFRSRKETSFCLKNNVMNYRCRYELYSNVRARTDASNALKTGLNDVAEDAVRSSTTDVGKSVLQELYKRDSEEEELKYGW